MQQHTPLAACAYLRIPFYTSNAIKHTLVAACGVWLPCFERGLRWRGVLKHRVFGEDTLPLRMHTREARGKIRCQVNGTWASGSNALASDLDVIWMGHAETRLCSDLRTCDNLPHRCQAPPSKVLLRMWMWMWMLLSRGWLWRGMHAYLLDQFRIGSALGSASLPILFGRDVCRLVYRVSKRTHRSCWQRHISARVPCQALSGLVRRAACDAAHAQLGSSTRIHPAPHALLNIATLTARPRAHTMHSVPHGCGGDYVQATVPSPVRGAVRGPWVEVGDVPSAAELLRASKRSALLSCYTRPAHTVSTHGQHKRTTQERGHPWPCCTPPVPPQIDVLVVSHAHQHAVHMKHSVYSIPAAPHISNACG